MAIAQAFRWRGHDWLFLFRTTVPLVIEFFPSRYLMEVWKQSAGPKTEAKAVPKDERPGVPKREPKKD